MSLTVEASSTYLSTPVDRCLTCPTPRFSPKRRITVEEALQHPYLEPYHDPQDEPSAVPLLPAFFDFDNGSDQLSREDLKQMIYQEIMSPIPAHHEQPPQ